MKDLNKVTGHANSGGMQQFKQVATADTTINFYGFMPVGADATLTEILNADGTSALTYFDSTTVYQNVFYPGNFKNINLATGKALLFLNEQ